MATLVTALAIFFNGKENRAWFLALAKRFWKSLTISAVVIAAITLFMLIQSEY